ncbi:MAG: DUF5320 domain-containing protein [Desulfobacterales bacterium]|nr:DUF5320 domain-containing protein [Desulfobacterales bacterium]
MPGFDQSGPMGAGPMTGGVRGRCGTAVPKYGGTRSGAAAIGRGLGNRYGARGGRGTGRRMFRGYGNRFAAAPPATVGNPADELDLIHTEAGQLKVTLETINNRITEMEKLL